MLITSTGATTRADGRAGTAGGDPLYSKGSTMAAGPNLVSRTLRLSAPGGTTVSEASVRGDSALAKSSKIIDLLDKEWEEDVMIHKKNWVLALQKASMGGRLGKLLLL